MNTPFRTIVHNVDFAVVGGGLAGLCAAIAAARGGATVAIMQDRPMFGGNASSEVRMWVCGANGPHRRETGIIEELELENIARNPRKVYSQWDQLMWDFVVREPNITAIMNCSCFDAEMGREPSTRSEKAPSSADLEARGDGVGMLRAGDPDTNSIISVTGWQTTTQQFHTIRAKQFADCSGDSILAPLTGAPYRIGREARDEFGESIQPETDDRLVMGMSVLIQARETDRPVSFAPPEWARHYESVDDLPNRNLDPFKTNFWWIELGGTDDTIHNTEAIRAELVARAYGIWDLIKNRSGLEGVDRLELEYLGLFPGKRESRRYEGDYMVTQNDVDSQGRFPDTVAFGGWSMDDHHPAALDHPGKPTIHHPAPSPWGIPLRSLYSRTVENLWFGGRNISVSHIALSSSRVMRTCSVIGQATGTAAAIALREGLTPREVTSQRITEVQRRLMDNDAWLPGFVRPVSPLTAAAQVIASDGSGDPETLRTGVDRHLILSSESMAERRPSEKEAAVSRGQIVTVGDEQMQENGWRARPGDWALYEFSEAKSVSGVRLVFDSNLARYYRDHRMLYGYFKADEPVAIAPQLVKSYTVEIQDTSGAWHEAATVTDNFQRLRRHHWKAAEAAAVRLTVQETRGNTDVLVFGFDILGEA